jgi:peroxiredoxin
LLACFTLVAFNIGSAADSDLPRYWLKVGQELSYVTTSEVSTADGQALMNESTWQVWVVKQNADGTWRLILRHASSFQPSPAAARVPAPKTPGSKPATPKPGMSKPAASKPATAKPPSKPTPAKPTPAKPIAPESALARFSEQVTFAYCDFSPDGSVTPNPTLGFQFEVQQLLPKLPKTQKELEKGWAVFDKATQVGFRYRVEEEPDEDDDEPQWTIVATRQSPVDDIYLSRSQSTYFVDADRGVVERIESKLEQAYGIKGTAVSTTTLAGVEQFDAAWCKKLDEEMGHYFAVQKRYQTLLKEAERNSSDAETLLVEAGVLLQKAAADITLPVVKEDLGKQVAQHAAMIGLTARAARDRAELIDQPAPTWQTKDASGKAHTLRDYKGKVVVLHFWRRGDGWALRSLPQVEQIAEQFGDKPVVVLGMNTDPSEEDARFVADKMGLAYPILRADKFADKYNVAAGSALFVIDPKGVIRDIYVGYSPSLHEDVASAVTGLLSDAEK